MSHPHPALSQKPSTALLALKRFVRGSLKQLCMGFVSLMLILGMSAHLPTAAAFSGHGFSGHGDEAATQPTHPQTTGSATLRSVAMPSHTLPPSQLPSHILKANMTHHHLTDARLSIPAVTQYALTGLRESK